jgi:hypothetical protein
MWSAAALRWAAGPFARNLASYTQRMLQTEQAQLLCMNHVQPLFWRHVQEGRAVAWGVLPRAAEYRALPRPLRQWHLIAIRSGWSPLASRAALAALLAALLFFFPPGTVIIVLIDGSPPGSCAAGAPEDSRAAASTSLGDVGRTTPLLSGGPFGLVQSVAWLSPSLSDTTFGSA